MSSKRRIAFLHPNLCLGGAEQLIVNFALALQQKGHEVVIFTGKLDKDNCFPETIDGTLNVQVLTQSIPLRIGDRLIFWLAFLKMLLITVWILLFEKKFDLFIVDQTSSPLPLLWLFKKKTIFYNHFPDKLTRLPYPKSLLGRTYAFLLSLLEELTVAFATKILVNSKFTLAATLETYPLIKRLNRNIEILYPATDFTNFLSAETSKSREILKRIVPGGQPYFFSLNRFMRGKKVELCIQAYDLFRKNRPDRPCALVIAGGYSANIKETVDYEQELKELASHTSAPTEIIFLRNIDQATRLALFEGCICVCFTPQKEHFGIVPVEAMYLKKPVICHNSGGPVESVGEGCGFLLEDDPNEWAQRMEWIYSNPRQAEEMGLRAKKHVENFLSFERFASQGDRIVNDLLSSGKNKVA